MKHIVLLLCGCLLFPAIFAQPASVLKTEVLRNAGCSYSVINAEDGRVITENLQVSLVPASVMKLVTTAAALEILGTEFKFHTRLGITGTVNTASGLLEGNLVLMGGCDPAFYSEYFADYYKGTFEAWAEALSNAGIKSIKGDFIIDLSRMAGVSVPGGWVWADIGNYYGAGVSALTYSDNYYKIHFSSPAQPGKPVKINGKFPVIDSLYLENRVFSSDINRDLSSVYGAPGSFTQLVEGTIPKGNPDFIVKAAMPAPAGAAITEFTRILKHYNIGISGKIRYATVLPEEAFTVIADKSSPPLSELIVPLNHESINLFAEHLLREIGRARKGSSDLDSSLVALSGFWQEKNIFLKGFYPTDGCGLSRSNGISPRTLTEILRYMYLGPYRDVFFNSLPVAGRSGTLRNVFKGTKFENNLHAKTGSMTRVRSLAGIFTNPKGQKVIFAIITNNFEGSQASAGHSIENFMREIYSSSGENKK